MAGLKNLVRGWKLLRGITPFTPSPYPHDRPFQNNNSTNFRDRILITLGSILENVHTMSFQIQHDWKIGDWLRRFYRKSTSYRKFTIRNRYSNITF